MQIVREATNLVIIGAWNPAILQPSWLGRHVFGIPEGQPLPVKMAFTPIPGAPPKWTIEGITFVPSHDRLFLSPVDLNQDTLSAVETKAIAILNLLHHTPVGAFGQNFHFVDEQPAPELVQIFALNDDAGDRIEPANVLVSTSITTSYAIGNCVLNLTRSFSNGRLDIKFNFHYDTSSAADAVAKLANTFSVNYGLVIKFLQSYHVVLDAQEVAHG